MVKINDPQIKVTISDHSRSKSVYIDCVKGKCFDDGTHCRAFDWYSGTRRQLMKEAASRVAQLDVIDCGDAECEFCNDENLSQ